MLPIAAVDHRSKPFDDQKILALLPSHTYEELATISGRSKGSIYAIALKHGARKTESRIQERKSERTARQLATLQAICNTTAKADVLDFLEGLPDDSVDAHVTSPPYNIGKGYGEGASADAMRYTYFHGWLMQIISEMSRTLKVGGVIAMNIGKTLDRNGRLMPMSTLLFQDFVNAGLEFQNEVVWRIPHGLTPKRRLADRHETVLIFAKGSPKHFNPNSARTPQKQPGKRAYKGPNKGQLSGNTFGSHPTDVWDDLATVRHNHPERKYGAHPAQFPVSLPKRVIQLYTLPGDLICDPFSGSGSTHVAAIETGRNFVGADLFYEHIREKRLADAGMDNVCNLPGVSDESVAVWQAEARKVQYQVGQTVPQGSTA